MLRLRSLALVAIAALALTVSACVGGPSGTTTPAPELLARGEGQLAAKRWAAAADAFLEAAAGVRDPARTDLRLRAVEALLDGGLIQPAREVLRDTRVANGDAPALRWRMATAQARLALAEGRPQDALTLLEAPDSPPPGAAPGVLRTRAEAHEALGASLAAAAARSDLDGYLSGAAAVSNRDALWSLLEGVAGPALEQRLATAGGHFLGWLELARVARTPGGASVQGLQAWRGRHPDHPALAERYARVEEAALLAGSRPQHVALLLPLEGPFAEAGAAVRDGFLAAWYRDPSTTRPRLSLFGDDPATLWDTYEQALGAGADFAVGPLIKDSVGLLRAAGADDKLPIPTLALNYAAAEPGEPLPPAGLYQFGLSPENEAREVALRAWFEGFVTAVAVAPQGDWGDRVIGAFRAEWEQVGGRLAETARYSPDAQSISEAVATLLNVDASSARAKALQGFLGRKLEFDPYPRSDADFVFLAAFPEAARQIRPQLRFHRAAGLPALATSHVYGGTPDPVTDGDLNGVTFADMPWVLAPQAADPELQTGIEVLWPQRQSRFRRLFALGVDAYRLLPHLGRMAAYPTTRVQGVSGRLGLDPGYRIHRELLWASFEDGRPILLDPPADPQER